MQLKSLKNIEKGKNCFLFGTGPSLNETDFSSMEKWDTLFGLNTVYKGMEKFGWHKFSYYYCNNNVCWNEHKKSLLNLNARLFVPPDIKKECDEEDKVIDGEHLCKFYVNGLTRALNICFFLGFDTVYLAGVDHNYSGWVRWDTPLDVRPSADELDEIEKEYQSCYEMFTDDGREIVNCSVKTSLSVFPTGRLRDADREKVY